MELMKINQEMADGYLFLLFNRHERQQVINMIGFTVNDDVDDGVPSVCCWTSSCLLVISRI